MVNRVRVTVQDGIGNTLTMYVETGPNATRGSYVTKVYADDALVGESVLVPCWPDADE